MYRPSFRTDKNNVPILSKDEIDSFAENYLNDYKPCLLKIPQETNIDDFSFNYLGLKQDFQYLSHNGMYLGMMVFNDTDKVPVYNSEEKQADYIKAKARTMIIDNNLLEDIQEHRYRFTVGHECGHDIYHYIYFGYCGNQISMFNTKDPMIFCRECVAYKRKHWSTWDNHDRMEWQANYMSSGLLMPKSMVIELSKKGLEGILRTPSLIFNISKTFNVSEESARYRLIDLGIIKETDNYNILDIDSKM